MINLKETDWSKQCFKISHDLMVQEWNAPIDTQVGLIEKGLCETCCILTCDLEDKKTVIVQIGASRFGVNLGICLEHLNEWFNDNASRISVPFKDSDDLHEISITINLVQKLVKRDAPLGKTEPEQPLSNENKKTLNEIIEKNMRILEQAKKEQERSFSCKTCKKFKDYGLFDEEYDLTWVNTRRKTKIVHGLCLGCGIGATLSSGCSIFTCFKCISQTKTCFTCQDGACGIKHDLSTCTAIAMTARNEHEEFFNSPEGLGIGFYNQTNALIGTQLPPILTCECDK